MLLVLPQHPGSINLTSMKRDERCDCDDVSSNPRHISDVTVRIGGVPELVLIIT